MAGFAVRFCMPVAIAGERAKSLIWWQNPFYRTRWLQWHAGWSKLHDTVSATEENGPEGVLRRLKEAHCDPDVALRLAFFVASQKPTAKSRLSGDNRKQQDIKRKLDQAGRHLCKAAFGLMEAALPENAKLNQKRVRRKLAQCHNYILKAANKLQASILMFPTLFIKPEAVDSLRAIDIAANCRDVALWMRLQNLAAACDHEVEALLWPRTPELPLYHELFALASYVKVCCGKCNYALVDDLLILAYEAYDTDAPASEIKDTVKRFRKLDSILPGDIEEYTAKRAQSGKLRHDLLTYYPD